MTLADTIVIIRNSYTFAGFGVSKEGFSQELLTLPQQAVQAVLYDLFRFGNHALDDFAGIPVYETELRFRNF